MIRGPYARPIFTLTGNVTDAEAVTGIRIGTNIPSLRAQQTLGAAHHRLVSTLERLSSGQRINRPSDDAAGLAVLATLNTDRRIYNQAARNLNDGISALNIADAAVETLSHVVVRLQELSEQSANGSLGIRQRQSINAEAQALSREFLRISRTTQFNGVKLLDGSIESVSLQAGYGGSGSISASLGGKIGTGSFSLSSTRYAAEIDISSALAFADINGDGARDMVTAGGNDGSGQVTLRMGRGDGTFFASSVQYDAEEYFSSALSLGDLNGDGFLDLVTAGMKDVLGGGQITVRMGRGDGGGFFSSCTRYDSEGYYSAAVSLGDLNADGILDLVTAGTDGGMGQVTVRIGKGDGTFSSSVTQYDSEQGESRALVLSDLNADGILDLLTAGGNAAGGPGQATVRMGIGDGTFSSSLQYTTEDYISNGLALADLNGDGFLDMVTAGNNGATVRRGRAGGRFSASVTQYSTESWFSNAVALSDLDGDGALDMVTTGIDGGGFTGSTTVRRGSKNGGFSSSVTQYAAEGGGSFALALTDLNGDGVQDLGTVGFDGLGASIRLAITHDGMAPLLPFDLSTMAGARQALPLFGEKLNQLSAQRAEIGAFQARVKSGIGTVQVASENVAAAAGRIADADMAEESSTFVQTRILQQAGAAVLAQANHQPSLVLTLLWQ